MQRLVRKSTTKGLARRGSQLSQLQSSTSQEGGRGSRRLPRPFCRGPGSPAPAPAHLERPACLTSESGGAGCLAAGGAA